MYRTPHTDVPPSNIQIQTLFANALKEYAKQTGDDLATHPLFSKIKSCNSVESITTVLREQADVFHKFRQGNQRVMQWIEPTINVVDVLSKTLGSVASLAFPPASVIFAGIGILVAAAQEVNASYDILDDLFESIDCFLTRLKIYSEIPSTPTIAEIVAKILVELLSLLALATKQVKQGQLKKLAKKIFGERDIGSVLQRLDRLTQEEARMAVAQTLEVVHGLVNNMKEVMEDGKASTDNIRQALVVMQEIASDMNRSKREQLQEAVRKWLSPPDPSKNHNIACKAFHKGTATWFIEGKNYNDWKTTGSLLWIHGKPGSGKSILCSTIIQNIKLALNAGLALMAYFYFDFRDTTKQDVRGLLTSLLIQFSSRSDACSSVLSTLYAAHNPGSEEPSDDTLSQCLKDMLAISGHSPTYIIIDALDECPNTSGMPSPRDQVLSLIEELVNLRQLNLYLCVTSRPESDIRGVLETLTSLRLSLHEENGQTQDIVDYINSVVPSDPNMRRWRAEDKQLVIDTLSQGADGMFRWVFCQFERLRHCLPASIRRVLGELPSTLDGTYERVLQDIHEDNWEYARRLFQCLIVASRPLRVEELAEVLAIHFDPDEGKIPNLEADWRPEDGEEAVMSTCSSLITVVSSRDSRVVQFSHFSVKEFLTSSRLITKEGISRFHILLKPAHTFLVKACLGVLLQFGNVDRKSIKNFPLAHYAAKHWFEHAKSENVSSQIRNGMEDLFDPKKQYFRTWIWLYNMEHPLGRSMGTKYPLQPTVTPLLYAAIGGFRDIVEWLVTFHSQDVNAKGHHSKTPLHHVSYRGHLEVAHFLLEHGVDVNARDSNLWIPLRHAVNGGHLEIVRLLLRNGAEVNSHDLYGATPLHRVSWKENLDIARLLLKHGAEVNARDNKGLAPLGHASNGGYLDMVQLLLDNGADVNITDNGKWTPLHKATERGHFEIAQLLLKHGAEVDPWHRGSWTPLHQASVNGRLRIVQLLLNHGADVNSQSSRGWTPLYRASYGGHLEVVQLLLKYGADPNAIDTGGKTALDMVEGDKHPEIVKLLSQRGHGM